MATRRTSGRTSR